jgi:hypothetical protein
MTTEVGRASRMTTVGGAQETGRGSGVISLTTEEWSALRRLQNGGAVRSDLRNNCLDGGGQGYGEEVLGILP